MREKRTKNKHRQKGFTLAETLLAVLILLMVSIIVANGIPAAKNSYEKVVIASNAEVLLSTTISTLRNELGTAQEVKVQNSLPETVGKAGTMITYYNPTRGSSSRLYVAVGERPEIMFQRYYSEDGLSASYNLAPLIPEKTSTGDLFVTYASVSYADGIITFRNLSVNRVSGAAGLASRETLSIRVIAG